MKAGVLRQAMGGAEVVCPARQGEVQTAIVRYLGAAVPERLAYSESQLKLPT
jgi:hypothetical protein